jgi:hypothetical protein
MARTAFLVLVCLVVMASCGQPSSPAERQEKKEGLKQAQKEAPTLPDYDITMEQDCDQGSFKGRCYSVTTAATSEKSLRALTEHFRSENPEAEAVLVTFYPPKQTADTSGGGYFFKNKEAAHTFLGPSYTENDVNRIMDEGGYIVVSVEDVMSEATKDMCKEWDTTTMGTPPAEWNCPGSK